jgi:hypothetical protein
MEQGPSPLGLGTGRHRRPPVCIAPMLLRHFADVRQGWLARRYRWRSTSYGPWVDTQVGIDEGVYLVFYVVAEVKQTSSTDNSCFTHTPRRYESPRTVGCEKR